MATQRYGLPEGCHEVFAVRTGTNVLADFRAHVIREFIVDESRQRAKNAEAPRFALVAGPGSRARTSSQGGTSQHNRSPFATRVRLGHVHERSR
jgi:hypothetical protein